VGSAIMTSASGAPTGNGGPITISGPSVLVENGGRIASDHSPGGNGGDLTVTVQDLTLRNGGSITSSGFGEGSSGHIHITATGILTISGQFFDPNNPGSGGWSVINNKTDGESSLNGGIDIHAGKLIMKDGPQYALNQDVGQIESDTGASAGGTIRIIADDSISMSSGANIINRKGSFESGSIKLSAPSIALSQSAIRGRTNIERDAGAITLNTTAGSLTLSNDSHVLTSTLQSSGKAGPIVAEASDSILLSGGSTIESSSSSVATGDGGPITLTAENQVTLSGTGTALRSTTAGSGDGGTITLNASQVQLNNGGLIAASTTGAGAGGTITVNATDHVTMTGGASITASSTGPANAGNLSINAGQSLDLRDSSVKTESVQASGGNIDIQAVDRVRLVNSTISTSVPSGVGNGGNITIDPNVVVLQNSQVIAQAVQGAGGNITITTPLFLADQTSLVSASSQFGLNGTVTIQSPTSNLSGSLGPLTSKPSQAQSLLTQRCAALANGQASSFVVAGREQLPADPGTWLTSPLAFAALGENLATGDSVASGPVILAIAARDTGTVSLRRLTPAGFLIANFADSEATGCHS